MSKRVKSKKPGSSPTRKAHPPATTSPNTWELESITSVPKFLAAVALRLKTAHTVTFEIRNACPAARVIYKKHRSSLKLRPYRDTFSPKTRLYPCIISPSLAQDLELLLRDHPIQNVLWHVKGFDTRRLLFSIHDADAGCSACLSLHIDEETVRLIASAIEKVPTKLHTWYEWDEDRRDRGSA
jgi:hypothetical protein